MSDKQLLVAHMVRELSTMKYFYAEIAEGCYDAAINNKGYAKPKESKESIVKEAINVLNQCKDKYRNGMCF